MSINVLFRLVGATGLFLLMSVFGDANDIRETLKTLVDNRHTVGIVVGIIDANGKNIYSYGKTAADGQPVDGDTVFEIGSATKTFTATLLADLVVRKSARLDDPIAPYLPKNNKVPSRGGKEITLLDLATHRSGLPRMPGNFQPIDIENPYADYNADQLFAFLTNYQLPRDIDSLYEYSNLGSGLLGEILGRQAGKSYEALLSDKIFRPLEMKNTGVTLNPASTARLAAGHTNRLVPVRNWNFSVLAGCGAIHTTANDLLSYVGAYLGLVKSPLREAMDLASEERKDTDTANLRIGLAWHILKIPDTEIVWHNGGTGGFHSFVGFDRKKGMGIVVLSNSTTDIDEISFHFLNSQLPLPKIEPRKEWKRITLAPEKLDQVVGEYQLVPGFLISITQEKSQLFLQATGQPRLRLFAETENEFFLGAVETQITISRNEAGRVTHLVLHVNGQDIKGEKTK